MRAREKERERREGDERGRETAEIRVKKKVDDCKPVVSPLPSLCPKRMRRGCWPRPPPLAKDTLELGPPHPPGGGVTSQMAAA
jgi:hypothetical protein